jgi:hypothetical protein
VLDKRGRTLWEKRFPDFTGAYASSLYDRVVISDIDGDRKDEILFNYSPVNLAEGGAALMCFERNGALRWTHRFGAPRTFGNRAFTAAFRGCFIRPVTIDGRRYVLAAGNHYLWYPARAALLDPADGKVVEEYWHPGAFSHCILRDLDGDGRDEAILGAINNPGEGLGRAAVAVLKLPFSGAGRPAPRDADPLPAVTGGGEFAYLLFPRPDVSTAQGLLPILAELAIDQQNRIVVETPLPENGGIVYHLDFRLNVLEHRFSDNYPSLHNRLHRQRLLDHPLTAAEMAALGRPARFRAAPDGNAPALEKYWGF